MEDLISHLINSSNSKKSNLTKRNRTTKGTTIETMTGSIEIMTGTTIKTTTITNSYSNKLIINFQL